MAPNTGTTLRSSFPGLWKYPTYLKEPMKHAELWMEGKKVDDNTGGLWRVHDALYDFTDWVYKHPGGSDWLKLTKGSDITEAFEAHHVTKIPEHLLKQFYVRAASEPRNSPYTFKDDGFYRTLKRKAQPILQKLPSGPSAETKLYSDLLLIAFLLLATVAAATYSFKFGLLAGLLLNFLVVSAHNFFHMKDNLRMYYFDLCLMGSRNWRISHALSHHLYTNSLLDLELVMFEPLLQWVPHHNKHFVIRYVSWIYSFILYIMTFHSSVALRLLLTIKGRLRPLLTKEDVIPFIPLLVMYTYSGATLVDTFVMWCWVVLSASFFFSLNGFNAAHHHPDIFHDGDTPRADPDWGICQIDAVRDRIEINSSKFLGLVTFGDHCLHHIFPTIDHWHLQHLYPVFYETCKEFGITYKIGTILDLVKGQFLQLARTEGNPKPPGE